MRWKPLVFIIFAACAAAAAWTWWPRPSGENRQLVLYGNIDLRQVDLPFNDSQRITAVLVQEGDRIKRGQLLAKLDTSRLSPQVDQAKAVVDAQRAVVERFHNGSRPEEIAEARANLASAKADVENARQHYQRLDHLTEMSPGAVAQDQLESAKAALDAAEGRRMASQKALDLEVLGPRQEDIAQAEAQLRANEAQLAFLRQELADTELRAPSNAIVRSRLMEPGEISSPQRPVFSLAITDPKWVRAYVPEANLNRLQPGMKATVAVDAFPNRRFDGWVGFISPQAEFTPKDVETPELRTSLVYEVRVFVIDPEDELRLGTPATVYLPLEQASAGDASTAVSPFESPAKTASPSETKSPASPSDAITPRPARKPDDKPDKSSSP
jgi:HlyD family secretion protein